MAVAVDSAAALVSAVQALRALADAAASRAGKYTVDMRSSQGLQVGDHNRQSKAFQTPAGS